MEFLMPYEYESLAHRVFSCYSNKNDSPWGYIRERLRSGNPSLQKKSPLNWPARRQDIYALRDAISESEYYYLATYLESPYDY